jgi:hypothetical protein
MEHVVFYPAADGSPAFRRFAALEDAVRFVEHLRNSEGVLEFSVHELTEVPVAVRAYYKVEISADSAAVPAQPFAAEPAPVAAPAAVSEPADEPAADGFADMGDVVPASSGKRSLGFFSH